MKISCNLLLFILFPVIQCWSQKIDTAGISIDKIPAEGILLDKGWKFHGGEAADWAKPNIDDSNWDTIDPSKDIYYLPEVRKAEIGWFRLKMYVDSSLFNQTVALIISQVGASEIYLNGRRLYNFGEVNREYAIEKTHYLLSEPFGFKFDAQPSQVIAIRFSCNRKNFIINYLHPNPTSELVLKNTNEGFAGAEAQKRLILSQDLIQIAFFLLLGLMCLFFYLSFRNQLGYVFIGLYAIGQFAQTLIRLTGDSLHTTSLVAAFNLASHIVSVLSVFIAIKGLHILYNQRKSWFYNVIIIYALLTIPAFIFFYPVSGLFALCFYLVLNIESIRVLLKAVWNNKSGAWVLLTTFCFFYVLFLSQIILFAAKNITWGYITGTISLLIVPVGLSLFLASEFGRTGRALQIRLGEVQQLSKKTIQQEQEKQHILACQKEILEEQVAQRTLELQKSLTDLKTTQAQLIQSEKMASLGELTAGIAHEIQNPINFVNNFSEVSVELVDDLKKEATEDNKEEVIAIADDLIANLQKVIHHGKRADAIVKGMLQHSRASAGKKELTDINALADEYLRLSYHGLRAKDKDFNADFKTDFDNSLGRVEVVPQDIGRVLLNLYNNAFYAVNEKKRQLNGTFEPTVTVSTRLTGDKVEIVVKDNGNGIQQKVVDKIFQPFFTTKPTGQGTGLGLSLSYDIIKAHGGELRVETKEGAGVEFIIQLPII